MYSKQGYDIVWLRYYEQSYSFYFTIKNGALSNLIRGFKKFTAITILKRVQSEPESRREWMLGLFKEATKTHSRNKNFQFWQYGNHAVEIYSEKFLCTKLDYLHLNPVRAGLVSKASDYLYSSASNYVNGQGITDLATVVDNPIVNIDTKGSFNKYLDNE